jgi:WhiB family transcriptional regulator, redox-sensing transcriptional regulator
MTKEGQPGGQIPRGFADAMLKAESWRVDAKCKSDGVLTSIFYTTDTEHWVQEQAVKLCNLCPVRPDCLLFAVKTYQTYGMWGGRNELELRTLRRKIPARERKAMTIKGILALEKRLF